VIKNYSNIDDLFRDKFEKFELDPPDYIWDKVKQQIPKSGTGNHGGNFSTGGIIGITILLIITSIFTIYLLSSGDIKNNESTLVSPNNSSDKQIISVPRSVKLTPEKQKEYPAQIKNSSLIKPKNKEQKKSRFELVTENPIAYGKSPLIGNPEKEQKAINDNKAANKSDEISEKESSFETQFNVIPIDESELMALNIDDEPVYNSKQVPSEEPVKQNNENIPEAEVTNISPEPASEVKSDYGKQGNWLFGLYFTPEIVFYPSQTDYHSRSYTVDANIIYHFSEYFLQSGIGISWSSDIGKDRIDYNQYLGSYNDVYDITFDTVGGQVIPVYHTEKVMVYDTIDHISITPTKRHYTYLNVPVLFGYGSEGRRFGWFVKGGPSLSVLIHENVPDVELSGSQDKILEVENEISGRLQTNWQFVFSGGVSYKLSNSLSFTVEPTFRYYINSIHETGQLSEKNPYSAGLKIGFLLGF
jgi:hypothetical protein